MTRLEGKPYQGLHINTSKNPYTSTLNLIYFLGRNQLRSSRSALERLAGEHILGYRVRSIDNIPMPGWNENGRQWLRNMPE